jgi:hypothetical protein
MRSKQTAAAWSLKRPRQWIHIVLGLTLAGCAAHSPHPLPTTLYSNDPDEQMEFWHTLPTRPIVDNDEAFHALLLFFDGNDPNENYAQRLEQMHNRKMVPGDFHAPADEAISRGVLAVALTRELKIRGGLTMMIIGPEQRYSTRELQYMNLYPPSSPQQTFSGQEFIGIISRVEDYQRQQEGIEANKAHQEKALNER